MFWRLTSWNNFGPSAPTQEVIRDAEEFKRIWGRLYPVRSYEDYLRAPKLPNIDFAKEAVILVALGSKSSGGYGIRIDSVTKMRDRVDVMVTSSSPGDGCAVTTSFTWPVDLIRLEIPAMPVEFFTHNSSQGCK